MSININLVLYLTSTYPSVQKFKEIVEKCDSIVDLFEIGVPTLNPKYDGPTVRMTYREAELLGVKALEVICDLNIKRNFIIMTYLEDYLHDFEHFVNFVKSLGARSILLPDLLFDFYHYVDSYVKLCERYGMEPTFFISSKFPYKIVRKLLTYSPYFIYLGLQASSGIKLPLIVERNVKIMRELIGDSCRLYVGFAIRDVEEIKILRELGVHGVVIGSSFIKLLKDYGLIRALNFLKELKRSLSDNYECSN